MDAMASRVWEDTEFALAIEAALVSSNSIIGKSERQSYGARCYNVVHQSMIAHLVVVAARLFDPAPKHKRPYNTDIASVPLLAHLLKQKRCQDELLTRARDWTPSIPSLADANERSCQKAIDAALSAFYDFRNTRLGAGSLKRLKGFRDTVVAHSLRGAFEYKIKHQELHEFVTVATTFTEQARLAIDGHHIDSAAERRELKRVSDAFWKPALASFTG